LEWGKNSHNPKRWQGNLLGGGVLLGSDERYLLRTRTRGINGVRIERSSEVLFLRDAVISNRMNPIRNKNGYLGPKKAVELGEILSDTFGLELRLHLTIETNYKNDDVLIKELKQLASRRQKSQSLPARERFFHHIIPAGPRFVRKSAGPSACATVLQLADLATP
jgi:hypothetical protein